MALRRQKPYLFIGSPMCTAFCTWQAFNYAKSSNKAALDRAYARATVHMEFVAGLCAEQAAAGRYFLREHPSGASSWGLTAVKALQELPGVTHVNADQCQYGATAVSGRRRGGPVKTPTGFFKNSLELARALGRQCAGGAQSGQCSRPRGGEHVPCIGRVAREAAIYPRGRCRGILKGATEQMKADRLLMAGCCRAPPTTPR